ncbi:MAG: hypothetical protein WC951_04365 [Bacteroidales bacterium]
MDLPQGSVDYRGNEFFSFRYSTRFQKNDIVELRVGQDLEAARFQARKSFPDVLNEYWWLKPSDIAAFRELPLKVEDIYFYHGGVPVVVFYTANGNLARKAQVFLKKRDDSKYVLTDKLKSQMLVAHASELDELILSQDLLVRKEVAKIFAERFPGYVPLCTESEIVLAIHQDNFSSLVSFGSQAVGPLVERFFVTTSAKETEKIVDTLIEIGLPALPFLEDMVEYLSLMASPYYAKRINWAVTQIKKQKA